MRDPPQPGTASPRTRRDVGPQGSNTLRRGCRSRATGGAVAGAEVTFTAAAEYIQEPRWSQWGSATELPAADVAAGTPAAEEAETGVYTGYNTMNMALAVPADGRVIACDINVDFVNIGKPFWREAEVDQKIDLRIKPAVETLDELLQAGEAETFDFAFIDADKVNYGLYYEKCLQLIRKGGVIAIDNVLWGGKVLRPGDDRDTLSIVKLNEKIYTDSRVNMSMLSIADGLTLVFKL
ncbi:catechol O-methyltransferase domain-containing protein 1 isoform X2 [Amblyraja radiata]|uniref:catechol O-methyltransferase domain-containing protein 1 isoform X2 n=1 Tax=Amblyraja radiata TaxID=386614 RepID=UPI0014031FA9|nr:catechol O-methyltransferase domain-containing protein 1 isoform X2 [Amblyraja radiata]